jgi:hypothetical protein
LSQKNRIELEKFKEKDGVFGKDWAYCRVIDIANGTKHAKKSLDNLHLQAPGVCGIIRCGFPMSPEPYVFIDDRNAWLLYQLTDHVADKWKKKLGIT